MNIMVWKNGKIIHVINDNLEVILCKDGNIISQRSHRKRDFIPTSELQYTDLWLKGKDIYDKKINRDKEIEKRRSLEMEIKKIEWEVRQLSIKARENISLKKTREIMRNPVLIEKINCIISYLKNPDKVLYCASIEEGMFFEMLTKRARGGYYNQRNIRISENFIKNVKIKIIKEGRSTFIQIFDGNKLYRFKKNTFKLMELVPDKSLKISFKIHHLVDKYPNIISDNRKIVTTQLSIDKDLSGK